MFTVYKHTQKNYFLSKGEGEVFSSYMSQVSVLSDGIPIR